MRFVLRSSHTVEYPTAGIVKGEVAEGGSRVCRTGISESHVQGSSICGVDASPRQRAVVHIKRRGCPGILHEGDLARYGASFKIEGCGRIRV